MHKLEGSKLVKKGIELGECIASIVFLLRELPSPRGARKLEFKQNFILVGVK